MKRAAFLVPTHHRPHLLRACLKSLRAQEVPEGWEMGVTVLPGNTIGESLPAVVGFAEAFMVEAPGWWSTADVVVSSADTVTGKLNAGIEHAKAADLILLADDDDLQPVNRLTAAVAAYEAGADWSGVGTILFYHPDVDRVVHWQGPASKGLVGTSLSFRRDLLVEVGGWPEKAKGKDGPMAKRIRRAGYGPCTDITERMGRIVCVQHGGNLWQRPVLELGETKRQGRFTLTGLGTAAEAGIHERVEVLR